MDDLKKLFEEVKSRIEITQEEFDEQVKKTKEFYEKKGITENLEYRIFRRLRSYYGKVVKIPPVEEYEGAILGTRGMTDWAEIARRKAEDAGKPNVYPDNWKGNAGKPIPEHDYSVSFFGLLKQDDGSLSKCYFNIRGNDIAPALDAKTPEFLWKLVKVSGRKSGASTREFTEVNIQDQGDKTIVTSGSIDNPSELLEKYFADAKTELNNVKDKVKDSIDPKNLVYIKGDVERINLGDSGRNSLVVLHDVTLDIADEGIACWVPPGIDINFDEMSQDVIAIGEPRYNEEREQTTMNTFCVWAPDKYRVDREEIKEVPKDDFAGDPPESKEEVEVLG